MAGVRAENARNIGVVHGEAIRPVPRILVCDPLPLNELTPLIQRGYHVDIAREVGITNKNLPARIGDYRAVIVRSATVISKEVLERPGDLEIVIRAGVGIDNIDVKAATQKGIMVVNTPKANTDSAAEHTVGLALAVARHIPQSNKDLTEGRWTRPEHVGTELSKKTWGLIGIGNVGSRVANVARGLSMSVIAYDPYVSKDGMHNLGVTPVALEEVFAKADVISLHVPLKPETRSLVNAERIATMKPNAILVNTARGEVVDLQAVLDALDRKEIGGFGVDVYEEEPPPFSSALYERLFHHPTVVTTSHLGGSTTEAQRKVTIEAVEELINHFEGVPVRAVNIPRISPEEMERVSPYMDTAMTVAAMAASLLGGKQIDDIEVAYRGEMAEFDTPLLRAAVVQGLLSEVTEGRINLVNFDEEIKKRGLHIREIRELEGSDYMNEVQVRLLANGETITVSGSLLQEKVNKLRTHIVSIDGFSINIPITPNTKHLVLVRNKNVPGVIGRIGTHFGDRQINIEDMHVHQAEQAMVALTINSPLTREDLASLAKLSGVLSARYVRFP